MNSVKIGIAFIVILVFAGCVHLIHPVKSNNIYSIPLGEKLSYAFNADSPHLARLVVRFPNGFIETEQGMTRILRPLYPFLGWMVYRMIYPLKSIIPEKIIRKARVKMNAANHPELWMDVDASETMMAWASLIFVSMGIYWISLMLIYRALATLFSDELAFGLSVLPVIHFDTFNYCIVPHMEPFNMLVPALFLYALFYCWRKNMFAYRIGMIMGVCMLGKALIFPAMNWFFEGFYQNRKRVLIIGMSVIMIWFVPYALYVLYLYLNNFPIHNHEAVQFRQFVWILDYVKLGSWMNIINIFLFGLKEQCLLIMKGFPAVLIFIGCLLTLPKKTTFLIEGHVRNHLILYMVCCFGFWMFANWHKIMLTILYYPAFVILLGCLLSQKVKTPNRALWTMHFLSFACYLIIF